MSDLPHDWRDQLNIREQLSWLLILAALIAAFAVVVARAPEIIQALH